MSDSNILYNQRLPLFGFLIIGLAVVILTAGIGWAALTNKPKVIQGSGVAQSSNRTLVMSGVSGKIVTVTSPNGSEVHERDIVIQIESADRAIEQQTIASQITVLQRTLELEIRYGDALNKRSNLFSRSIADESHHYFQYEASRLQREQLSVDPANLRANGYSEIDVQNARKSSLLKIGEIEATAKSASAQLSSEHRAQIAQLSIRATASKTGDDAYSIRAAVPGLLYLNPNVKPGTVIAAGESIGTIASNDSGLSVKLYVAVPDRQFLKVGDLVAATVAGLPDAIYERLAGKISSIDNDVTTLSSAGEGVTTLRTDSVFGIDVKLDKYSVEGKNHVRHDLSNGAAIQAEFIYGGETYLEYFRGLLGL